MNDKSLNTQAAEDNTNPSNPEQPSSKKPFKWSILFIILALLLALAGLAGAGYIWLQFEQYKQQSNASIKNAIDEVNNSLQNKLESKDIAQHISPIVSPLKNQLNSIQQNNADARQARELLSESTQKLFELYGRDKNGWQLAEVEYLLRIAQHRLVIENDFQGAEKTLQAADAKISEIADPGLLAVRVAISDERVLLQTRKRPDLVGIVLSLSRIIKQIPHLDLSANNKEGAVATKNSSLTEVTRDPTAPWQEQAVQFIKGLVKVEPLKKSIATPAVSLINAVNTLEENLKLAKWAVLERDQQQYQQLVAQSHVLFKRYFDANNNYHTETNNELERLLTLEIRPKLPDISGSLTVLKAIMTKKEHQVTIPQEGTLVEEIEPVQATTPTTEVKEEGESHE